MNTNTNRLPMSNRGRKEGWVLESSHRDYDEYLPKLCQLLESNEEVMQKISEQTSKEFIPLWEKRMLTLEEASALFGIGINKLRSMSDDSNCTFVLFNQSRRLIKRVQLEEYLGKAYSI